MEKKEIIVSNKQSLADITIQEFGSLEAWFDLAVSNDISVTAELRIGQPIKIEGKPLRPEIVSFYQREEIKPSTALKNKVSDKRSGINHWIIGDDFIVQPNPKTTEGIGNWKIGKDFIVQPSEGIGNWKIGKDFKVGK